MKIVSFYEMAPGALSKVMVPTRRMDAASM
jgi:hypothetical protein